MQNLLKIEEKRRLEVAEVLFCEDDWITLSDLSQKLGRPVRNVRYDLDSLKDTFSTFAVETSHLGVQISFHRDKSLITLYREALKQSQSYQLLEIIFLDESYSASELADLLFVSSSTLYRLIDKINEVLIDYEFCIEKNPCRITGDEERIRQFFSRYFYEKYTPLNWPYDDEFQNLEDLLDYFVQFSLSEVDFAYDNVFKLVTCVNFKRYKNGHFIDIPTSEINYEGIKTHLDAHKKAVEEFEKKENIKIEMTAVEQVILPFIQKKFLVNPQHMMEKAKVNSELRKEVDYLNEFLLTLAKDNKVPISNKNEVIFAIHRLYCLGAVDPRNGYILFDRNKLFNESMEKEFPDFYAQLNKGLKEYQELFNLPDDEDSLNYLIYITYSFWGGLILSLRKKQEKNKVLIVSNRYKTHGNMLKDLINYEFTDRLDIDVYENEKISIDNLEASEHDFIVSNMPLPPLESKNSITIENIPDFRDYRKIQKEMEEVSTEKKEEALSEV